MGGSSSRPDIAGQRVLRVEPRSPASVDAWVPYFDVITHAGGVDLSADASALTMQLKAHIGRELELTVVVPSNTWGGAGLLGMTVRYDAPDGPGAPYESEDDEWALHVMAVEPDSPAAIAGIERVDDFIIGSRDISFDGVDALCDYVYAHAGAPLVLYIYRASSDTVRTLTVDVPEGGSLGVSVMSGVLHRLPNRDTDGVSLDGGRPSGIRGMGADCGEDGGGPSTGANSNEGFSAASDASSSAAGTVYGVSPGAAALDIGGRTTLTASNRSFFRAENAASTSATSLATFLQEQPGVGGGAPGTPTQQPQSWLATPGGGSGALSGSRGGSGEFGGGTGWDNGSRAALSAPPTMWGGAGIGGGDRSATLSGQTASAPLPPSMLAQQTVPSRLPGGRGLGAAVLSPYNRPRGVPE